jgi:mRNA interferase MazF
MARFIKGDVVVVQTSNIRPNRIFTASEKIILYSVGRLKPEVLEQVILKITDILRM